MAKPITTDQLTLSSLPRMPPTESIGGIGGNLNASVSISLRRDCNLVLIKMGKGVIFADDQRTVGLRGGDALRPSWTCATNGVVPFESIIHLAGLLLAQPTTVATGLPGRADRLSLSDSFCVTRAVMKFCVGFPLSHGVPPGQSLPPVFCSPPRFCP